jgi:integrase
MGIFQNENGDWFIEYSIYEGEGKCRKRKRIQEKIGPSKKLAEQSLNKRLTERTEVKIFNVKRSEKVTFNEFIPRYLEYSKAHKKPKSYVRDVTALKHLQPVFGRDMLYEIDLTKIEEYKIRRKSEGVKTDTINREVSILRAILNMAHRWDVLEKVPRITLFRYSEGRVKYLDEEEEQRLLGACPPHLYPIVLMAFTTGMRRGEILGLRWSNVNLKERTILIQETVTSDSPKSGKRRIVPISERLHACLASLERNGEKVFPYTDIKKSFRTACRNADIHDFRFHDIRHSFCSKLIKKGASLAVLKELLGHHSLDMVMRYSHFNQATLREAVEKA